MEENGTVLNYFYLGLKWACVMMLFIKDYLVQFTNVMPSICKTSCPVLMEWGRYM